ncbi:MAG: hypothetical protein PHD83_05350, partial [Caldisericia bacterium]|nr:hypothetical protein [Caldisericia bacterium]
MKLFRLIVVLILISHLGISSTFSGMFAKPNIVKAIEPENSEEIIIGGGLPKGLFFSPTYLNVEQQRLYVADSYNNRVQAFIRGNVFQLGFGGFGQNEREFDRVGGIASNNEKIFIVDSANARVQV